MAKTTFFHSCLGVFQGGGCRAAALVGAYDEATKRGVQFIEIVGTSAGSIIAALVGAGATPEQLKDFVRELDFRAFLKPPEIVNSPNLIARLAAKPFGRLSSLLFHQGFHSSSEIEIWMERCLRKLLGNQQGPIPFSKLKIPTSIVATDIISRQAHVWNQRLSPNESVAKAVRASCSIPIFFQPLQRQFIDGGVLSNLPSFVFANNATGHPLTSRILAFVLQGDDEQIEDWDTLQFLFSIANTVVEGSQELQLQLQSNVHTIVIPTGGVKATDFDKIDNSTLSSLITSGQTAAAEFFKSELAQIKTPRLPSDVCYDREDLFNRLTSHLNDDISEIIIGEIDTEFVYSIFPSLFLWATRGVTLRAHLSRIEPKNDHGLYRKRLLAALGVELIESDTPPFRGYLINCKEAEHGTAYVGTNTNGVEAVVYSGEIHSAAIGSLYTKLTVGFTNIPEERFTPKIVTDSQDELLSRLKKVSQYSKPSVKLSLEEIPVSKLVALTNYVHEYKYRQVQHWSKLFQQNSLRLFESAAIELPQGAKSIITPPVVEDAGGKYVLIEGSTRATFLRDRGDETIVCVVARGIQDPLPCKVSEFANVRVVGRKLDTDLRYENFNYALFRKIEVAVRPLNSLT